MIQLYYQAMNSFLLNFNSILLWRIFPFCHGVFNMLTLGTQGSHFKTLSKGVDPEPTTRRLKREIVDVGVREEKPATSQAS